MGCIYGIQNDVNLKWYIGKSDRDADRRKREHFAGNGNRLVKQAIEKYGIENFTFHILHDGIIPEMLDSYEMEAIAQYNSIAPNGYNLTSGGEGCTLSEETRKKISLGNKGKTRTPEARRKMSESHKGKPSWNKGKSWTKEARRKIGLASLGREHSESHKLKMSNMFKGEKNPFYGKRHSAEARRKMSAKKQNISKETRRKMSESHIGKTPWNKSPLRIPARDLFFSLSASMPLAQKRQVLYKAFPQINGGTIRKWIQEWIAETQ